MKLAPDSLRKVSVRLHENVEMRVEVEAYPPPEVVWSRNGTSIHGENRVITERLHETRWGR